MHFLKKKGASALLAPWGCPYNRTEGGMHELTGAPDDTCQVGVPSAVNTADRHFVPGSADAPVY